MARKAFAGDPTHKLPKGMIEPYRLWFEFLKLALTDPEIRVDECMYKDWGEVRSAKFREWWHTHWRQLFAEPPRTRRISSTTEFQQSAADPNLVILSVSVLGGKKRWMREVEEAMAPFTRKRHAVNSTSKSQFQISGPRRLKLDKLRITLRMYQFWLQAGGDLNKAVRSYERWATAWNGRVKLRRKQRKSGRPLIAIPNYLVRYVEFLDQYATGKLSLSASGRASRAASSTEQTNYEAMRNQTRRYLRRARKIAQNVAKGVFPGRF